MDEQRPDVVVVGAANFDFLARAEHLPRPGQTLQGHEFQAAPGGKGANQAVGVARLGIKPAFIACVGQDKSGDRILEVLAAEGVDVSAVTRHPEEPTGRALITVDRTGEKQIVAVPGANARLTATDVRRHEELFRGAKVVILTLESPMPAVIAAAKMAQDAGAKVVLDPSPPAPIPDELMRLVDIIKPDAFEALVLTGVDVKGQMGARRAGRKLVAQGVSCAIVQAGAAGDLAVMRDGERFLPRIEVPSVDATGAGDAFTAAIAVALVEGGNEAEAAVFGWAAAALATTRLGAMAGLPTRAQVLALLQGAHDRLAEALDEGRPPAVEAPAPSRRRSGARRQGTPRGRRRHGARREAFIPPVRGSTVRGLTPPPLS